jgi:hypothetical protein
MREKESRTRNLMLTTEQFLELVSVFKDKLHIIFFS